MSLLIGLVGKKHTGKTTYAVKCIKSFPLKHIFVNDKQHDPIFAREKTISKFYGPSDDYIKLINKYAYKNARCGFILEEAATFLQHGNNNPRVTDPLLSARHHANIYICNFHALQQIPEYIMFYLDYIVVKKSAGQPSAIRKKFENYPEVIEAWYKVNASSDRFATIRVPVNT